MMNIMNTLDNFRTKIISLAVLVSTVLVMQPSSFAAVSTRQIISNMAIGEYTEEGSTVVQVSRSNLVQTTILPVYSVNLTANNAKTVIAGQTVYFSHTLTNTGNETDQYSFVVSNNTNDDYDFNNVSVFLDKNSDGVPDGAAISSYALSANESVGLIVAGTLPNTVALGQNGKLTLNVNSSNSASGNQTNIAKVTDQSALVVRKKFSQTTVANGDVVTIRLDYQNLSNVATGSVTLIDTLDSSLIYQPSTGENWNGTAVDPNTENNDPAGINYSVTSNVVSAVLSSVAANSIGYIEFKVKINQVAAGPINNTVGFQYDHDNDNSVSTLPISDLSNTAVVNIAPIYAVKINGSISDANDSTAITVSSVMQGGELVFNNYVWNTGNSVDRFNVTFTANTFPVGSQIEFYRADGVTPLLDSNGDGIADTGLLSPSASVNFPIIVKVRLPSSYAVTSNTPFEVSLQAQSIADRSKISTIKDQGSLNPVAALVDLTNSPENNALGNGNIDNAGVAWKTVTTLTSINPVTGGQAIFPLKVSHMGVGTEYLLSANASSDFTSLTLPSGVNRVRFYVSANGSNCNVLGAEIGKTSYLNNGESQLVCAAVEVDKINDSVTTPIYFRVLSTSFVSGNNGSNPSQDTIKNAITIQSVNAVAQVEFMPNSRGQVAPLGTVVYSHTLINNTNTDFSGNYSFLISDDQQAFNSTLFYDVNGNGVFDAGDLVMRSLADLPSGKLAAHQQVKLLLQVKNMVANNIAQANNTIVNLTNSTNGQVLASITDVTTVNQAQLKLNKLQARDFDCDGNADADEAYTMNSLSIGKQSNGQGQCVLYKVILTNSSAADLNRVFTFRDMTPAYTVLSKFPVCTSCSSVTSPAMGQVGALTGTLNSVMANQSYEFNFGVRYVGQ